MTQRTRFFRLAILLLPSAALAQNYQGSFDAAWCSSIGGWAWDAQNPSNHINVDIYDGSTYITSVPANIYRPDLAYYQIGDGSHAFSIATPSPFKDGNYHTLNVKYGATSLLLPNGPHSVAVTPGSHGKQS